MLTSLAIMILLSLGVGALLKKLQLPELLGMLAVGMILGPYMLDLIDNAILAISGELCRLALIVILIKAGLSLEIRDLKKVGRPALLLCFIPTCCEILAILVIAPKLLGISLSDAAILGSVFAAVSPAIVIPRMLKLSKQGYGKTRNIPQMIMAGASVDCIFAILLFQAFIPNSNSSLPLFAAMPLSILLGVIIGTASGYCVTLLLQKGTAQNTAKALSILSISLLFSTLENTMKTYVPFSGLTAIMFLGITIAKTSPQIASGLSETFSKLWVAAEILLFVLVGASINLTYGINAGPMLISVLFTGLFFRMIGVLLCTSKTNLRIKERIFCMLAYLPKATVQAAIGSVPISMGLSCGPVVLTAAVLSILITAPLGAIGLDLSYRKLLKK